MDVFKNISTATASSDLKKGVESGLFDKLGEKNKNHLFNKITGHEGMSSYSKFKMHTTKLRKIF